jgi:hypothetical protein
MRICILFSALLISLLLLPFVTGFVVDADSAWTVQIVDGSSSFGQGIIAVDSNNNPHIAYGHIERSYGDVREYVLYASWNGSNWNIQNVTRGSLSDFKLGADNKPCILYETEGPNSLLMFAAWTGTQWNKIKVASDSVGSLALDSKGNPHVAFKETFYWATKDPTATLSYAVLNGSIWNIQTVDAPINYNVGMELKLDSQNKPHILCTYIYPNGSQGLKYAILNGTRWDVQTAFNGLYTHGNMVLDSNGFPHFTIAETSSKGPQYSFNLTLKYAGWDGLNWNTQTVDFNISGNGFLALDQNDYPHIDYYVLGPVGESGSLMYASWTGTSWDIQTVGPNSKAYADGPLALDSYENPHITYLGSQYQGRVDRTVYCMYATLNSQPQPTQTQNPTYMPFTTALEGAIILIIILISVSVFIIFRRRKVR